MTKFAGFKAVMTHVLRYYSRNWSFLNKKEKIEPVTIIKTPGITVVGIVEYVKTVSGLWSLNTVFIRSFLDNFKR